MIQPRRTRRSLAIIAFLAVFVSGASASAQTGATELADLVETCAACHGEKGQGDPEQNAPRLAGQGALYLAEQLSHFAAGRRGAHEDDETGRTMAASAADLDAEAIRALAAHYAGLGGAPNATTVSGGSPAGRGAEFYAANCAACHGDNAVGADVLYVPNLALLDATYLRRQIKAFREGWRGGDGASTRAKGMREMAFQFDDEQAIDDLIAYLTSPRS